MIVFSLLFCSSSLLFEYLRGVYYDNKDKSKIDCLQILNRFIKKGKKEKQIFFFRKKSATLRVISRCNRLMERESWGITVLASVLCRPTNGLQTKKMRRRRPQNGWLIH